MDKLSSTQYACLEWMVGHPGATYDRIPFRDTTIQALQLRECVKGGLIMPSVTPLGLQTYNRWKERP